MIGSRSSAGRSERTRETASRTSSTASCVGFSRRNSTVIVDDAVLHRGVDVLDALQRRDRVLDLARDFGLELRRRRARQRRRDGHRRQVDVREVLDLHRPEAHQRRRGEQDEQQQRRDRVADRPGRDVHHGLGGVARAADAAVALIAAGVSTTRTVSPSARNPPPMATTRASGASPSVTSMRSPTRRPTSTLACVTLLSGPTRKT